MMVLMVDLDKMMVAVVVVVLALKNTFLANFADCLGTCCTMANSSHHNRPRIPVGIGITNVFVPLDFGFYDTCLLQ